MSLPLTHIERMDEMRFKAEHEKELERIKSDRDVKVAKERRKEERAPYLLGSIAAVCIATVLGLCIYGWWIDEEPVTPEQFSTSEAGREQRCIENGGGWVPEDILANSSKGMCVFPGQKVSE